MLIVAADILRLECLVGTRLGAVAGMWFAEEPYGMMIQCAWTELKHYCTAEMAETSKGCHRPKYDILLDCIQAATAVQQELILIKEK